MKPLLAVGVIFVVALGASLAVFATHPASIEPTCSFGDGRAYCAMANGERAKEPFSRRVVAPTVVRALPGTLSFRFRAVATTGLLLATAASVVLADRIGRRLGMRDRSQRVLIAVIVGSAGLVAPHGFRLALSVPVLVDHAGLAIGLIWMVLFTARSNRAHIAAVPAAFLAVCTREVWVFVIVVAAFLATAVHLKRPAAAAGALGSAAAAITAFGLVLTLPSLPIPYSERSVIEEQLRTRLGDFYAIQQTIWALIFAVGLLPVVMLCRPPLRWLRHELAERADITAVTVLLSATIFLVTAPVSGTDLTRLAYPGGVLLLTFATPWLVAHKRVWWAGVVLAVATVLVWTPTHQLITDRSTFVHYYYPASRKTRGLALAVIAVIAAGLLTLYAARRDSRAVPSRELSTDVG